jgi:hypothetical protein
MAYIDMDGRQSPPEWIPTQSEIEDEISRAEVIIVALVEEPERWNSVEIDAAVNVLNAYVTDTYGDNLLGEILDKLHEQKSRAMRYSWDDGEYASHAIDILDYYADYYAIRQFSGYERRKAA